MKLIEQAFISLAVILVLVSCNDAPTSNAADTASAGAIADAIYFNGDIITMEGDSATYAEAVAIKDSKIVFVGNKADAEKMKGDSTVMNDLKGKTMMPGLIDPHLHPTLAAGILPTEIVSAMEWKTPTGTTKAVKGKAEYLKRLKEISDSYTDPNKILITWGYFAPYHGKIVKDDLNKISATRPIVIWQRSCHEIFLNDKALEYFKITEADFKKTPQYANFKEGHFFETGLFVGGKPVLDYIGRPEAFAKGLAMSTEVIHKGGLTTIGEPGFPQIDLNMEVKAVGDEINKPTTPFKYAAEPNAMYLLPILKTGEKVLKFCDSLINTGKGKMSYVRAIKLYVDGAIFSQLMIMKDPYLDHHHGVYMMQPAEQNDIINTFYKAGWDIHAHVNGDGGLDTLLAMVERAKKAYPASNSKIFLEHYGYARKDQHLKVAAMGLYVSCNPYYYYELSAPYSKEGLGPERASEIAAVGSLEKLGVSLSFHSDYFMAPAEPLLLAWTAINRINSEGKVLAPEEKVSVFTAMKAITIEAARSLKLENRIGTITKGKDADFVLLAENPFKIDPVKIKDIKIYATILGGKQTGIQ